MTYSPDPAFQTLFKTFTSDPESIGAHLTRQMVRRSANDPLLVATGTYLVLFPGGGRPHSVEGFRSKTRGFIEMAGVSHLGAAAAWIVRQRELGDPHWRQDAMRLIEQMAKVREVNSEAHWREHIGVGAFAGREAQIANLVDYTCAVTTDFLLHGLDDEAWLSFDNVRDHYLDPQGPHGIPVSINDAMVATFALTLLDIAHRVIAWLHTQALDWERTMVIINGANGRLTGGLSFAKNNICHMLWQASGQRLAPERFYIAPYAPAIVLAELEDPARAVAIEAEYRRVWLNTRSNGEVGREMFKAYPAFVPSTVERPLRIDATTTSVDRLPQIQSPDDRLAIGANLRVVMEDPTQLVSNCAAQYVIDQLCANGNRPQDVLIPGLSNVVYPAAFRVGHCA